MINKKVLFIQNSLPHYRIPLYEHLGKFFQITVCHFGKSQPHKNFQEIVYNEHKLFGFRFQTQIYSLIKNYDVIIGMFDLRWLSIISIPYFINKKQKFYFWGIGVSTEKGLDKDKSLDKIRFFFAKQADGLIFYSDYPVKKYLLNGFPKEKLFVAHNTVECENRISIVNRKFKKFLFIGSITKRKKINVLIDVFEKFKKYTNNKIYLEIVGDGPEKNSLVNYVKSKNLTDCVIFSNGVYNYTEKGQKFIDAICTISLGQAGLAVLESFSYGVPFITLNSAISGGEKFNIIHGFNGYLISNYNDLLNHLVELSNDLVLTRNLSENSINYYWSNRTIENMASTFINVIEK